MTHGLQVSGAVVRYRTSGHREPITAVDHVDLAVTPGEVVALVGPSGSGKSSLLRAIAGLEPLVAGRISWSGDDLTGTPTARRGFGMMFQDAQLFTHLSVAGNVGYGLNHWTPQRRQSRIGELLALVGLPDHESRRVTELSGGQAQRVALARALAPQPRLLLLDEPLTALDRELREHLTGVLAHTLRATGTTAIHVTHDQDEAFALGDRVAVLMGGAIKQIGAPADLWRRPNSVAVATFLGYGPVIGAGDAAALGLGGAHGRVGLGPGALVPDPAGREVDVVGVHTRRGWHEVAVTLPDGQPGEVRYPLSADLPQVPGRVRVRLDEQACVRLD